MPRFVILEHDFPELHWDFMLECGSALKTWRLARPPVTDGDPIAVTPLSDHRLQYLVYEGPVSGDRGNLKRWDAGEYEGDLEPATWRIRLQGGKISASAVMEMGAAGGQVRFLPLT